jgi:hypothetical protein|tara:strand:- start:13165 stop:13764 length:600 start_codon:yes stop_codon:yes gene_type:complete
MKVLAQPIDVYIVNTFDYGSKLRLQALAIEKVYLYAIRKNMVIYSNTLKTFEKIVETKANNEKVNWKRFFDIEGTTMYKHQGNVAQKMLLLTDEEYQEVLRQSEIFQEEYEEIRKIRDMGAMYRSSDSSDTELRRRVHIYARDLRIAKRLTEKHFFHNIALNNMWVIERSGNVERFTEKHKKQIEKARLVSRLIGERQR